MKTAPPGYAGTALDEATGMNRLVVLALGLTPVIASPAIAAADGTEAPSVCASCVVMPSVPAPAPRPVEFQHRFGVAARGVSLSLDDGTTKTDYSGGGIALSYRLNRRWEFAATLDMLDAPQGPDLHSTTFEARFHINPLQRWDWYALAGIGALHEVVEADGGNNDQEDPKPRGRFHAGVGLERRFPRWSLAAELRAVGVGPKEEATMDTAVMKETPASPMATEDKLSGGELTVAASFYF